MAGRVTMRSLAKLLVSNPSGQSPLSLGLYGASNNTRSNVARALCERMLPFTTRTVISRLYSTGTSHLPQINDPDILQPFKDLMAASWDELPYAVVTDAKNALSKSSSDKKGQEALENVFRAAEAVEKFGGILVSLRMELDDKSGVTGENVKPLPDDIEDALHAAYKRYMAYLDAFGPDEIYLKKKVEMELGSKMIHIKMRCSNLGSEWGKISVLGTSGISGSYVEHRS